MTNDVVSAELRQVLRDLKLSGVLDTLPERVALARQSHLPRDETDTADIYELVVERHRRASTIVTTNREPPTEWLAAMADPLLAEAAIDRLTSNAYQLVVDGPSYRQRQRPGRDAHPGPPHGGPTPSSRSRASGPASVKAKPSGRPPAGLDPRSTRPPRRKP